MWRVLLNFLPIDFQIPKRCEILKMWYLFSNFSSPEEPSLSCLFPESSKKWKSLRSMRRSCLLSQPSCTTGWTISCSGWRSCVWRCTKWGEEEKIWKSWKRRIIEDNILYHYNCLGQLIKYHKLAIVWLLFWLLL